MAQLRWESHANGDHEDEEVRNIGDLIVQQRRHVQVEQQRVWKKVAEIEKDQTEGNKTSLNQGLVDSTQQDSFFKPNKPLQGRISSWLMLIHNNIEGVWTFLPLPEVAKEATPLLF